jgi:Na+/phosphate symporter
MKEDPIVQAVIDKHIARSKQGMETYGVSMERKDLSTLEWLEHAQQEMMDAAIYLEKIIWQMKN